MGATLDPAEALAGVPLFSVLTDRERDAMARTGKEFDRAEGAILAKEGESGVGFFLLLEGSAEVSVKGETRAALAAGDAFGEIALLDDGPRTATVTATSPVRMLGITAWAFKALVREHPEMAVKLLEVLAGYVRRAVGGEDTLSEPGTGE